MRRSSLLALIVVATLPWARPVAMAQRAGEVVATLELSQQFYYAGDPFFVRVTIGNEGAEKISNPVESPVLKSFRIVAGDGTVLEAKGDATTGEPTRPEKLAPSSFYGAVVDLTRVFPGLRQVGEYEIGWSADGVSARKLTVRMLPKYDSAKQYRATIETDEGPIVIDFYPENAPIAVKAFIDMANAGFYDGLLFHEVRADRYISGGDPRYGETPRTPFLFPAEFSALPIVAGSVVLKPAGTAPPANGPQFMILFRPEPSWTGQVTVLGQVVRGMDIARKISRVPSNMQSSRPHFKPLEDLRIRRMTIEEQPSQAGPAD